MNSRLNGYWNDLRGSEPYARISRFNVETIPGFGQHAFMLDLHNNSQDPVIRFAGQRLTMECGQNVAGERLSAVPAGSLLARVATNFKQVLEDEAPREFNEELEKANGDRVLYRGIMLPFSRNGTGIDYIVGAITSKTITQERASAHGRSPDEDSSGSRAERQAEELQDEHGARGLIALVESNICADSGRPSSGQPGLRASLDECQNLARNILVTESRSRKALYDTLERVYAFYLEGVAAPEELEALLAETGLTRQERAPFTPIVKLVFGADLDRTRLSEYAAALANAKRLNQDAAGFRSFIEAQDGGLKACVKAERAARRAERGSGPDATEEARRQMREAESLGLVTEDRPGETEFVLLFGRRVAAQPGGIEVLSVFDDKPATIDRLLRRAARQRSREKLAVEQEEAGFEPCAQE